MTKQKTRDGGYLEIGPRQIHLDGKNPRHTPLERDAEIIQALCDQQLVALASDISQMGSLSPLDVLGAVEFDGVPDHYIAVEGNRRTCALILLADPSRAPTTEYREIFKRLSKAGGIPQKLHIYVFADRTKAKPWVDRRHLGDQGGVGTREWDNSAKARAAAGSTANTTAKADVLALAVVDRLGATAKLTPDQQSKISLTTLSRYLNNSSRRAILGLRGLDDKNQLIYTHDHSEVDAVLAQLVMDSLPRSGQKQPKVHSRSSAVERDAYVQSLAAQGMIPSTRLAAPTSAPAAQTNSSGASKRRSTASTANRNKLMLPSFTVKTTDKPLVRLRSEMLGLPIEGHEFSANYLLRAFIERVLILYLRRKNPTRPYRDDQELCRTCHQDAVAAQAPRRVADILGQSSSKTFGHSLYALGSAVHLARIPTRRELVSIFDTWEPALRFMLDAI